MKYVIDKLSDLEIIKVTVLGALNQDIRKEIYSKAVNELKISGYHRLIMDLIGSQRLEDSTIRTVNAIDMFNSIKKIETEDNLKIAVLSKNKEDSCKHFVKLAHAIGHLNTRHFSNYEEAITWFFDDKSIFT